MNISIILILLYILIYYFSYTEFFVDGVNYLDVSDYDIQEIPNFLTEQECNTIIELSRDKLFTSKVYSSDQDLLSNNSRKSKQCWLDDQDPVIKNISDRIKYYTNTHDNYHEQLQVVNYQPGGFFRPHYDACEGDENFCKRMNEPNGPRYLTILIYLNDDFTGGETIFPQINKTVKPKLGKAIIFQNVDERGVIIKKAIHGGEPVKSGEKWVANKWIRIY